MIRMTIMARSRLEHERVKKATRRQAWRMTKLPSTSAELYFKLCSVPQLYHSWLPWYLQEVPQQFPRLPPRLHADNGLIDAAKTVSRLSWSCEPTLSQANGNCHAADSENYGCCERRTESINVGPCHDVSDVRLQVSNRIHG
jgi:hypothetical protein